MDENMNVVTETVEEAVMEATKKPIKGGLIGAGVACVAAVCAGTYFAIKRIRTIKAAKEAEVELEDDFEDEETDSSEQ